MNIAFQVIVNGIIFTPFPVNISDINQKENVSNAITTIIDLILINAELEKQTASNNTKKI